MLQSEVGGERRVKTLSCPLLSANLLGRGGEFVWGELSKDSALPRFHEDLVHRDQDAMQSQTPMALVGEELKMVKKEETLRSQFQFFLSYELESMSEGRNELSEDSRPVSRIQAQPFLKNITLNNRSAHGSAPIASFPSPRP